MRLFKVLGKYFKINAGMVRLDADQARRRLHCLKLIDSKSDDNRKTYLLTKPTGFKKGELFWHDGVIGKAFAKVVDVCAKDATTEPETPAKTEPETPAKTEPETPATTEPPTTTTPETATNIVVSDDDNDNKSGLPLNKSNPGYGKGSGPDSAEWQKYDAANAPAKKPTAKKGGKKKAAKKTSKKKAAKKTSKKKAAKKPAKTTGK